MKQLTISSTHGKLLLFATILASGMAFLDGSVVNIAIPTIQTKFNATLVNVEWVVNAYTLLLSSLILISGSISDKFGRKKIFLYGILVFVAASFLCSIASSIEQLIIFRSLQGIGGAMMVPGSLSIINTSFAENVRGRAIGLWSGYAGGVAALGPFLGGLLVQTLGWQSIFYINIPLGLLAIFLTIKYVPESKNEKAGTLDYAGTGLMFVALLGISYALINIPTTTLHDQITLLSLLAGVIALIAFFFVEKRSKHPLVPFEIFKSKLVVGANLATLFLYFALSGVIFFVVLYLQQGLHMQPIYAGMSMLPAILLITFLSGKGGSIADKYGPRFSMIVGPLIVAIGMASFVISGPNANYFISYFPGMILFGIGMALVIAPLTKSALAVESQYSGAASGVNNAVARIAGLLAVVLIGGVVLVTFSSHLNKTIEQSTLQPQQKSMIMSQTSKLGAISLQQLPEAQKRQSQVLIDNSLLYSFKWAMAINASLALLSAIISALMIRNTKK